VSYADQQRWLLDLAVQLSQGKPLLAEQKRFLSLVLYRIGSGEDANTVLRARKKRGEKLSDVIAKRRMSLILHWVACAINPDPDSAKKVMSLTAACELATTTIVPFAKAMFPGADNREYNTEYIQRCWGNPKYAHMRSTERGWFDADFPYHVSREVKDTK